MASENQRNVGSYLSMKFAGVIAKIFELNSGLKMFSFRVFVKT